MSHRVVPVGLALPAVGQKDDPPKAPGKKAEQPQPEK
jgi:hypothetical protein